MIGPAIGGALARPCKFYPNIFLPGSIWDRYPYLLPNLFSAVAVFIGLVVGILFLEETHPIKKHEADRGVILGQKLLARLSWQKRSVESKKLQMLEEEEPLLDSDEQLPGYQTTETSPRLLSSDDQATLPALGPLSAADGQDRPADLSIPESSARSKTCGSSSGIFTKPIILNTISFGILAL